MNFQTYALLEKEWIKLRRFFWLLPLLAGVAAVDAYLTLNTITRVHGAMGLWVTIISKEPVFFRFYFLLAVGGALLGFFQAWPDCQGKRLRLMYHLPMRPLSILGVQLVLGCVLLVLVNGAALGALALVMGGFHLSGEIIFPVLYAVTPWALLSFILYFVTTAFIASHKPSLKVFVLACGVPPLLMLLSGGGYGEYSQSIWRYVCYTGSFFALACYCYLRFLSEPRSVKSYPFFRGVSLLICLVGLCTLLPALFWRVSMPERITQNMLYSPVKKEFVSMSLSHSRSLGPEDGAKTIYKLQDDTEISFEEYCEALPFLYGRNLIKWGKFPATIGGYAIPPQAALRKWSYHRYRPRDWNRPVLGIYFMLESNPVEDGFALPDDVFRVRADSNGIAFLNPEDGKVNIEKSKQFNTALRDKGFIFPITMLGGNPDTRKDYDVGYFLVDANNGLFQLQMVDGKPHCLNWETTVPGKVLKLDILENRSREFHGAIISDEGLHAIKASDMTLRSLPVENYDADQLSTVFISNPVNKTLLVTDINDWEAGVKGIALDSGFNIVQTHRLPRDEHDMEAMRHTTDIVSFLFPVSVQQRQPNSNYASFDVEYAENEILGLTGGLVSLLVFIGACIWRKRPVRMFDATLTFVFGPVALLAVALADWDNVMRLRQK